jgi:hypothetical protein
VSPQRYRPRCRGGSRPGSCCWGGSSSPESRRSVTSSRARISSRVKPDRGRAWDWRRFSSHTVMTDGGAMPGGWSRPGATGAASAEVGPSRATRSPSGGESGRATPGAAVPRPVRPPLSPPFARPP